MKCKGFVVSPLKLRREVKFLQNYCTLAKLSFIFAELLHFNEIKLHFTTCSYQKIMICIKTLESRS